LEEAKRKNQEMKKLMQEAKKIIKQKRKKLMVLLFYKIFILQIAVHPL